MRLNPVVAAASLLAFALPALAEDVGTAAIGPYKRGTIGVRETVCADSLYVRTEPLGAWMGTLYKGQTFLVEARSGEWVYGFAYGNINRRGWVQDGWFCW